MNIIHIVKGRCNPDTANGVEKTICNLAFRQAGSGHNVTIIGVTEKQPVPIPGVKVVHIPPPSVPWLIPRNLKITLDECSPDVVHFHSVFIPLHATIARYLRRVRIPYVVTPHGGCAPGVMQRHSILKYPYKWVIELPFLNAAHVVHSVGDTESIRNFGVTSPIKLSPNGIDFGTVPDRGDSNPVLDIRPDWVDRTTFVFIGRLAINQKGLDLMIRGFANALKTNPKLAAC